MLILTIQLNLSIAINMAKEWLKNTVVNTVKLNFEEWADAVAGRSTYRINIDEVISNVQILESIINSAEKNEIIKNNRLIDEMMSIKNYVNNLSDEDQKKNI